jgi:hypothetical protein
MDDALKLPNNDDAPGETGEAAAGLPPIGEPTEDQGAPGRALLERYRSALLASDPSIPADLVTGETADAIETSFNAARELVTRIRGELSTQAAQAIPAGAPGRVRGAPMTAFEKIRQGLGSQRG